MPEAESNTPNWTPASDIETRRVKCDIVEVEAPDVVAGVRPAGCVWIGLNERPDGSPHPVRLTFIDDVLAFEALECRATHLGATSKPGAHSN